MGGVKGSGATTCVFVVVESAVRFTNDRIEVAIAIDIRQGGFADLPDPDINAIEGVSRACLGGVKGSGATTCVFVVVESAVTCTNDRIEVAIAIDIPQGGVADKLDINAIEGVSRACLGGVNGSGSTTCVFVVFESARPFTNDRIKVAIPIDIRQGGSAVLPDTNAIEGVSRACLGGVNGSGSTTCVFVVFESARPFTNDRIKVAIPIDIRQGGSADQPDINAIEGVSRACLGGVAGGNNFVNVGNGNGYGLCGG